jgi:hypothetical protein
MGFFSWVCPGCKRSVLSSYVMGVNPRWSDATAVTKGGVFAGTYDGYGRLVNDDAEIEILDFKTMKLYHTVCYVALGRPGYEEAEESEHARDQGFFVDPARFKEAPALA